MLDSITEELLPSLWIILVFGLDLDLLKPLTEINKPQTEPILGL